MLVEVDKEDEEEVEEVPAVVALLEVPKEEEDPNVGEAVADPQPFGLIDDRTGGTELVNDGTTLCLK